VPRRADFCIAVTEELGEILRRRGVAARDLTCIAPAAAPRDAAAHRSRVSSEALVCYAGNLDGYQNLGFLLQSFARVRARVPAARLVLVTHAAPGALRRAGARPARGRRAARGRGSARVGRGPRPYRDGLSKRAGGAQRRPHRSRGERAGRARRRGGVNGMELRPRVAITMGDAAGIGPEIIVKALADASVAARAIPLVLGEARVLERAMDSTGVRLPIRTITKPAEAEGRAGTIELI